MIRRLVLFGASGDLAARKLLPALAQLIAAQRLPERFSLLGIARQDWDDARFRRHAGEALERHAADVPAEARRTLCERLAYRSVDLTDAAALRDALAGEQDAVVLYLALPPALLEPVVGVLGDVDLHADTRIVCEKPFGTGLESARRLNRLLARRFGEDRIHRVDHFLLKQTLLNILGLRFGNRILEAGWSRENIERVEIVFDETLALEGRAGYYDHAGALRDMFQSHLLQLLCLVAMEPPLALDERDLRDRKVEVLRAVARMTPEQVAARSVRARYGAGTLDGRELTAYAESEGVDPARGTETFAQVTFHVDNWRWAGVPFLLRSGKALARDRHAVSIHFRDVPHLAFRDSVPCANVLRLTLGPDRIDLALNVNAPDEPFRLACASIGTELAAQPLPAYARVLLHVLEGDVSLSIRGDEAEEAWRIVAPVLEAWSAGRVPLGEYPPGADIPLDADRGEASAA